LLEDANDWFENYQESPYMQFVLKFKQDKIQLVPAVIHQDGTARLQTVREQDNKWYYDFLKKWKEKSGVPIILNTSFNDREPICEDASHSIRCFLGTKIDYLYFPEYSILLRRKK
jgi:carbamoyltransferase